MSKSTRWATRVVVVLVLLLAAWQAKMAVDDASNLVDAVFSLVPSVAIVTVCAGMWVVTFRGQKTEDNGEVEGRGH